MSARTIAVAGKGGTGKTTFSSLMIRELVKRKETPILAVDADPNSNLGESLGEDIDTTIGGVLSEFLANRLKMSQGMTKESYLEMKIEEALEESRDVDFLVMGRKEGPGCYCVPHTILKNYMEKLLKSYRYVVVDNEAGMEHLSRKTMERIDVLILVTDHSAKGLRAAGRILGLIEELGLDIGEKYMVINRFREDDADALQGRVDAVNAQKVYTMPEDPEIARADALENSFYELADEIPAVSRVSEILEDMLGLPAAAGTG